MNVLKFLNKRSNVSLEDLRSQLFKNYIKWYDDKDVENTILEARVILYSDKFKSDFKNPISKECNGLVLYYNNKNNPMWKILVKPIECFNMNKLSVTKIDQYYKNNAYKVYKAVDGTVLNLYFYKEKWRISSCKGYDVSNIIFVDGLTYMEVVDLISKKYPNFSFEKMNIRRSYTICIRYRQYHIFNETMDSTKIEDNTYMILLQSVDTSQEKLPVYYDEDIGIPLQKPILTKEKSVLSLINNLKQNFQKIEKNIQNEKKLLIEPLYGYILRSKTVDIEYRNIFLESELMKYIRLALYNNVNSSDNDYLYMKLETGLNRKKFSKYMIIFRQYTTFYKTLHFLLSVVIPKIIKNNKNTIVEIPEKYKKYIYDIDKFYILIAALVKSMNNNNIIVNSENINIKNIIYDYIHDTRFIQLFYEYFNTN